ncbi:hypothetical protein [Mesobacillus foraminis]|uniref:Uncharacterized protein n=1 Tax=Mesobacillus foraminis TaxID=279826 RepID=A0A4R2B4V6_9BACI|nr:hypothetical protein [Mesobacillus foraminis]TCN20414.1 hypothetical protein EV146_11431 [Mesobacillus foraminis]
MDKIGGDKERVVGGANVKSLLKDAEEFVKTSPVPSEAIRYRRGKIPVSRPKNNNRFTIFR